MYLYNIGVVLLQFSHFLDKMLKMRGFIQVPMKEGGKSTPSIMLKQMDHLDQAVDTQREVHRHGFGRYSAAFLGGNAAGGFSTVHGIDGVDPPSDFYLVFSTAYRRILPDAYGIGVVRMKHEYALSQRESERK